MFFTEFVTQTRHDYIQIFDYINHQWIQKGRYSGNSAIPRITSTSNRLRVSFKTDGWVTRKGFSAYFFFFFGTYITNKLLFIGELRSNFDFFHLYY